MQLLVQPSGAELGEHRARFLARLGRDLRQRGNPLRQRAQVHPGPATEDRQRRPCHLRQRRLAPPSHMPRLRRREHAVERMRHAGLILGRRPRGDDAQLAVALHGIGVDDSSAEALGQSHGQRRFP
jgi:hypothetical protein